MIISFTGHRPDEFKGGQQDYCVDQLWQLLSVLKPEKCITGMALGVDQWAASVCISLNIPFIAAVPFVGQESVWTQDAQEYYYKLRANAQEVKIVSEGGYSPEKMQLRNEWMVDHSDLLIAVFNGAKGGTANCVRYAKLIRKPIIRINPKDYK